MEVICNKRGNVALPHYVNKRPKEGRTKKKGWGSEAIACFNKCSCVCVCVCVFNFIKIYAS